MPSMGKTAFAKLQPSCQWFITVSPGRSEMDSERDICSSSNEIRQIRWTIAGMYKVLGIRLALGMDANRSAHGC